MKDKPLTLTELQNIINLTFRKELNEHYWVTAEVAELKTNYSGHNYLELIDRDKNSDQTSARIRAIIWARQARFIIPYFKTTAGIELGEGLSILIKGNLEYHPIYGLSFVISDIDPGYTIGDIARKRNEIIQRLTKEGVIEMNGELELPLHPGSIAVISSSEAAGYEDFVDQLNGNPYGYKYKTTLFSAVMQGVSTSESVIRAFENISIKINEYDTVVIVRGGGSATDLSWFDDYDIAFMVSQFPLPVISGIGHERDSSVTDLVAHSSCKTPTATADFIIELSAETERYLRSLGRSINSGTKLKLSVHNKEVLVLGSTIVSGSRMVIKDLQQKVILLNELIKSGSKHKIAENQRKRESLLSEINTLIPGYIKKNKQRIDQLTKSIQYLSPDKVIKRGYSLSILNGKIIQKLSDLNLGDKITTRISDGSFDSEVFDIKE